jgi:hypothetical protein
MHPDDHLSLRLPANSIGFFIPSLGAGVGIRTPLGISLQAFLCDRLSLEPAYVRERIQTIFLNGRAVDRPEEAVIGENDVIALSAAMPGLAGAVLRRGGHFAAMRREISQEGSDTGAANEEGLVTLKLFNLVAREMGGRILQSGIWLTAERFGALWREMSTELILPTEIYCNDRLLDRGDAPGWSPQGEYVQLKVVLLPAA